MNYEIDPRDFVYNFNGVRYVGMYDSKGNFHPPCPPPKNVRYYVPKDQISAEINKLKTTISELEDKVKTLL